MNSIIYKEETTSVIPDTWCKHVFTEEEKEILYLGGSVYLNDCITLRRKVNFKCTVSWIEIDGRMKIWPKFDE